jgi:hypothetical protein
VISGLEKRIIKRKGPVVKAKDPIMTLLSSGKKIAMA